MTPDPQSAPSWKALFRVPGFPYFFAAMLISLFGTGMNFAGVTWYVLGATHSTVKVSLIVILVTLPGLIVPPFGGVLIDRVDRRYLGITIDAARAVIVLATAALAYAGRLAMWELYSMVLLLGVGFAIYWSTTNALIQELVPREQLITANATVLIAVQGGMAAAGALVGFVYERCRARRNSGNRRNDLPDFGDLPVAAAARILRAAGSAQHEAHVRVTHDRSSSGNVRTVPDAHRGGNASPVSACSRTLSKDWIILRQQPRVLALGITYSCMMAGVISANILVVALARDLLSVGATRIRMDRGSDGPAARSSEDSLPDRWRARGPTPCSSWRWRRWRLATRYFPMRDFWQWPWA